MRLSFATACVGRCLQELMRALDLVGVRGDGLHVAALQPEMAEAALRQALAQAGIGIQRLNRITPSLEDAFISLIQRAGEA